MSLSLQEQIQTLSKAKRDEWVANLPEQDCLALYRNPWWYIGRPEQFEPEGDWTIWLILSGRGWGKTITGAEWLAEQVEKTPLAADGAPTQWAIIAPRFSDTKTVCVEGPSGFLRALDRRGLVVDVDYIYNKSNYKIHFVKHGQVVHMFGADSPDAGRGLNLSGAWLDELAMWPYSYETWTEGIALSLRIGQRPRAVVTTTPKPIKLLRDWTTRTDGSVVVTRGSTFENRKLSATFKAEIAHRYEGTRIGRQEIYGELLEDVEGALWSRSWIDSARIRSEDMPALYRIVVAIDPAVTSGENSDETGIVVAGVANNGEYYVLEDCTLRGTPNEWGERAVGAFKRWNADRVVAEVNNGGDMVLMVLRQVDRNIPLKKVTATRGKKVRAEPISALYEQGRVHHVGGFNTLEDQMVMWTPDSNESPDRLDALVWALTELKDGAASIGALAAMASICPSCQMPNIKNSGICTYCGTTLIGE